MDATLLTNNTQHCWVQNVASVCMALWHLLAFVCMSLNGRNMLGLTMLCVVCQQKLVLILATS